MATTQTDLVAHYRRIGCERMRDLPIYNARLQVEAVGFRDVAGDALGVLVTPWFMNLVLLPGSDEWLDRATGDLVEWPLPAGPQELHVCHDDQLGTYLSAVLFRSVAQFPDQATARGIAQEVLHRLFQSPDQGTQRPSPPRLDNDGPISRRDLLSGLGRR